MKFDPKFMNRLTDAAEYNQVVPGYRSGGEILQSDKSVPFSGTDGKEYLLDHNGGVSGGK